MGQKNNLRLNKSVTFLLLCVGLFIVLLPLWYMIVTSFKPQTMVFEMPPRLWPQQWTLNNYIAALGKENFGLYFVNSSIVTILTTLGTTLIASMLAFVFAKMHFPGKEAIFYVFLLGMMVPPVMLIIPQFLVAKNLGLTNHLQGLFLVYITMNLPMQTFLLRGVFEGIPRELEEAALIDGGNRWTIFRHIILPNSGPGLAVVIINTFLYSWEEFPWANVLMTNSKMRTLPVGIALFQSAHLTEWGQVFAASLVALIPVIIIFSIFQRYFVQGIATTGLKG
ncbi:MAG: carbohydrate ABC transporter permease [Anaerolinea sp.]|nr:carbohydrate ABC transporter permease [Anaerolinea sp.]